MRIPSTWKDPEEATHIEFKPVDNMTNPYLALLALLAAGMDGVENEIDPGDPVNQDPSDLSEAERDRRGIDRIPETLGDSLDALAEDEVIASAFGEQLHQSYVEVKWSQWTRHTENDWGLDKFTLQF